MQPLTKEVSKRKRRFPVVCIVFFGAFYLFLWLCIDPELLYHHFEVCRRTPFFKTGWLFLQDSLCYPGGLSRYIAAFFTQLCYFSWLGALCITLIAWAIYSLTSSLTAACRPPAGEAGRGRARQGAADNPWQVICYVPALLVLMVSGQYESPLRTAVAVLVVGFFSVLYRKISPRLDLVRVILFLIVCGALYYFTGSAALVFIALAALWELFDRRKFLLGLCYTLLGPAVCWLLGAYVFELDAREIYVYSSPFLPIRQNIEMALWARGLEEALLVALPVIVLLVNSGRWLDKTRFFSRKPVTALRKKSLVTEKILYRNRFRPVAQIALLALVAVPSVWLSFDRNSKKTVQINYFHCQKMWPKVLAIAQEIPMKRYFPFCPHDVNRALYNTNQLGDQMFVYPQNYFTEDLVFSSIQGGNVVFMDRAEICMELGLVNVAEKIAYEFLGGADDSPFILKQLALINIVKGRIETARVFLRALSRNLIYAGEAKELLKSLESDPQLSRNKQVRHIRSVMMTNDYPFGTYNEGDWLEELLCRNKYNKMAFEYLMAHYLLTKQLDKFIENLPRLDDFDYKDIPRHYQEAIVLYIGSTRKNIDLGGRKVDAETIRQYNELNKVGEQFSHSADVAWRALAPRFGRTYYFYFTFGMSGVWQ
jgi:hypothetical protein